MRTIGRGISFTVLTEAQVSEGDCQTCHLNLILYVLLPLLLCFGTTWFSHPEQKVTIRDINLWTDA